MELLKRQIVIATLWVGITSGLAGMSLALLLKLVQHVAYGYNSGTFLAGVESAAPERRLLIMLACGLIAGYGWWAIRRFGKPLVDLQDAVNGQTKMPVFTSLGNILLQIITVGLGSPLGREAAPRELSVLIASWICARRGLKPEETRILLACGAGAGLAAVYNVPIAGGVFALEVLLRQFSVALLLRAMLISCIAVAVSWIGLGNHPAYQVPELSISASLIIFAVIMGPIFGFAGHWFNQAASYMRSKAQPNWQTPVLCLANFTLLGVLAIYFPALLGNGKSAASLEFDSYLGFGLTAILLLLRVSITLCTLRSGAYGGLLTPSVADGALLAVLLGALWRLFWPGTSLGAFAIVGAAAFLVSSQRMPITAIILIFEFTRVGPGFAIPLVLAVLGAFMVFRKLQRI